MIKWSAILLTIIFTALSVLQCTDGIAVVIENSTSQIANNDQKDTADTCSPLCACTCCGISISPFQNSKAVFPIFLVQPKAKNSIIKDVFIISDYNASIWHPPQFNV